MTRHRRLPFASSAVRGIRLHKLEVFNWGTFDGRVFAATPRGESALLIGRNGCGKSTLVDALLTLLVKPGVRNYNVAAGARKRERDERTYVRGAYDRGDEDGAGNSLRCLRPRGDRPSVVLACFVDADSGRTFTVAQCLHLAADQSVDKVHLFADGERSIEQDFSGLKSKEEVARTLKARGWRVASSFQEFEGWFAKATRIRPKAMEVFNQTVAVKDIQRLNDFIREHMLEKHDGNAKVDALLAHFTQLGEAHDALVRARQQAELLEPVARVGAEYRERRTELDQVDRLRRAMDAFRSHKTVELLEPDLRRRRDELEAAGRERSRLAEEMRAAQENARQLANAIENAGGDRLKRIPTLIELERTKESEKRRSAERFRDAVRRLGMTDEIPDERAFEELRSKVPGIRAACLAESERLREEQDRCQLERAGLRRQLDSLRQEQESLARRRDNVPDWCVALRRNIASELGLPENDLPFAAELVQVRPEERAWEASIEKVLHHLALSLLVPERHYRLVVGHVERTRLAVGGGGRRLVYLRVGGQTEAPPASSHGDRSLLRKLAFRDGQPLLPWLKSELARRYDHLCCETEEEFRKSSARAVTRNRHVKSGPERHEKDDRDHVLDPRNFVLGWDNREKRRRIAEEIARLEPQETESTGRLAEIEREVDVRRDRLAAADEVVAIPGFAEIDHASHARAVAALEEEKRAIEEKSDAIRTLKARLAEVEAEESDLANRRDAAVRREGELSRRIEDADRLLANARRDLRDRAASGTLAALQALFPDLDAALGDPPPSVHELIERFESLRREQDERSARLGREIEPVRTRLLEVMTRFLRAAPEEAADLQASAEYLDDFLGLRQRILDDDLPRHERRFKERLNSKVAQEIGLFSSALERERREIDDKIELLNESLRRLEWKVGQHVRLEPRAVRDAEIADFQDRLRQCVDGRFEDSFEANEARFLRIRDLLQQLRDEGQRRWRDKVTDVRRWFDFVAAVVERDGGRTVSAYRDSDGQSGGEKAKLAFTILVAAIAYQYDLDPDRPTDGRFRFVVVDEMFSKVDDQHARYALDLFRQFGLQLLIVAPLDAKARVTQPYVGCYLHVTKTDDRSAVYEMTAEEFEGSLASDAAESALASGNRPR